MSITLTRPAETTAPQPGPGKRRDLRRRRLVRAALLGLALLYVAMLLLLPLIGIIVTALKGGWALISSTFGDPQVRHAFLLTIIIALITVAITTVFGIIVAWVLVRQRFHGRALLNALVDLPFALSPITVGLAAVVLFGRGGWFFPFFDARGIQILYALPAMILVTIFISIPFTIREIQPVLEELGTDEEDASRTLGASVTQTFRQVTLPNIRWALFYGMALSTARAIGEIGAVLLVSGLFQGRTQTVTLAIWAYVENRQLPQAYVLALTLGAVSILLLAGIEAAKHHMGKERAR